MITVYSILIGHPVKTFDYYFGPFLKFFLGNLRSVAVFLRFLEDTWDVFVKRLHMYGGASS